MSTANQMIWRMSYRRCCLVLSFFVAAAGASKCVLGQDFDDAARTVRDEVLRQAGASKVKAITIAMNNYHDVHRTLPAAFTAKDGLPLLSWRVALLPYLGRSARNLYEQFHLDEPWDSKHNLALVEQMPEVYRSPTSKVNDGRTVYLTPRAELSAFPGEKPISFRDIANDPSNTIAIIEVDDKQAVLWTKPDDWIVDTLRPKEGFRGPFAGGVQVGFCDTSVGFISSDLEANRFKALLTISGGELVTLPD